VIVWPFATKDPSQYQRPDQGFDVQAEPGAQVHAIASGVVGLANPDPGGFGNDYPFEVLDEDIGGPSTGVYYGHTHITVAPGSHVNAGDVIAVTNVTNGENDNGASENGSAAPPGWLEIGFAVPGTGNPIQHGSGATGAGLKMRELLIGSAEPGGGGASNFRPPRILWDAVTPENIPRDAQMVAGYIDGHEGVWTPEQWAYFPNAVTIRIAVWASTNAGQVLDVETGDATPEQAVGWVLMRRAAGQDPSVYCNLSTWPAVQQAFRAAGVPEPHYWIAAVPGLGGTAVYPGSIAQQFDSPGPYDRSYVAGFWPGVDTGSGPPDNRREATMLCGTNEDPPHYYELIPTSPKIIASKVSADGGLASDYVTLAAAGIPHTEKKHPWFVLGLVIRYLRAQGRPTDDASIVAAIEV
jgi:hypothetical protein